MTHFELDLLRRFVPCTHVVAAFTGWGFTRIETNDGALATLLSEAFLNPFNQALLSGIRRMKIIVDHAVTDDSDLLTRIDSDSVCAVLRGTATILIYDTESRELLVFLSPTVSAREFIERLLPAAVSSSAPAAQPFVAALMELQTSDIDSIAP